MTDALASATSPTAPPGVAPPVSDYLASKDDGSGVIAKMQKSTDQLAGAIKEGATERKKQYDAILSERPPEPEAFGISGKSPFEKPPEYKSDDPIKNFGGLASVIGIFGGMLTRRPLVTSLNAASGAMKAYHERNIEDYKTAVDEWKQGVDYTTKLMNWRLSAYEAATSQYKNNVAGHMAAITGIAANTQDEVTLKKVQSGDLHATLDHIDKQKDVMLKYEENVLRMKDLAQRQAENLTVPKLQAEAVQTRLAASRLPDGQQKQQLLQHAQQIENAIEQSSEGAKGSVISDASANFIAGRVLAGDPKATVNMGRGQQNIKKVEDAITNMATEQHLGPRDIMVAMSLVHADQSSLNNMTKMADAAISYERTANHNLDLALTLAPKGIPTNWGPFVNRWIDSGLTGAGNADVPPYVAALLTGANEYSKIMSGSTGAQGSTVDSRREAAEMISPYLAKNQIEAVVKVLKQDMVNRQTSLGEQIGDIKRRLQDGNAPDSGVGVPPGGGFTEGQVYQDANGNKAMYKDGKWLPQ